MKLEIVLKMRFWKSSESRLVIEDGKVFIKDRNIVLLVFMMFAA